MPETPTVYLLAQGAYDAYGISGVYSSLAGALAAADVTDDAQISEWTVDGDELRSAWFGVATRDMYKRPRSQPRWNGELASDIGALPKPKCETCGGTGWIERSYIEYGSDAPCPDCNA